MELQRRIRNDLNYTDKEWNKVVTLNHQRSKVNNVKMADKERNKLRVGDGRAKRKNKARAIKKELCNFGRPSLQRNKKQQLRCVGVVIKARKAVA